MGFEIPFFARTRGESGEVLRLVVEFRHEYCHQKPMLDLLRAYRVALVRGHSSKYPVAPAADTADFAYFRFHGPRELFASGYSEAELRAWADLAEHESAMGKDVYAYFNNAMPTLAPDNALVFRKALGFPPEQKIGNTGPFL